MDNEDAPDEEVWQSIRHTSMDELAQEIGRMCMYFSQLENTISVLLSTLLAIEDVTSKNVVMASLDFRGKLQMLLPMGFQRKPSDDWYARLEKLVNHIDSDIRNERNRMIHDYWFDMPDSGGSTRLRMNARVVNVQSRTKKLQLADIVPVRPKDVGLLYVDILRSQRQMSDLWIEYRTSRGIPPPLIPTPSQTPGRTP